MKKTCNGCRAITGHGCGLGKKTKMNTKKIMGSYIDVGRIPTEECDKPKTYLIFLELIKKKEQS
jgi:hypothetical protein